MEISFNDLKIKEVVNLYNGKRLGHIIDIVFDSMSCKVLGVIVPAEKKLFQKKDDIFISIDKIKKIGDDVILVKLDDMNFTNKNQNDKFIKNELIKNIGQYQSKNGSFVRFRRLDKKKCK